jgi:hypothetical protein
MRQRSFWTFALLAAGTTLLGQLGCEVSGVGDPCIPEDEYLRDFPGYEIQEVNIESRSFQCETRVCLVNHFQGRVSCPYGQTASEIGWLSEDAESDEDLRPATGSGNRYEYVQQSKTWEASDGRPLCAIPGFSPEVADVVSEDDRVGDKPSGETYDYNRVRTPVDPQIIERNTNKAVYCSCRCKNAQGKDDDGANYCECPNDFQCAPLMQDLGLGSAQLAGYYCIKNGTAYEESQKSAAACSQYSWKDKDATGYCGSADPY